MRRSMIPADARETLLDLIDEITVSLEELQDSEEAGELNLYGEGAKSVYVEVLEFIQQRWEESEEHGLDFDIEEKYVRNVQATSSNLVISTSQNLKRTPFERTVLGFFLFLLQTYSYQILFRHYFGVIQRKTDDI